ncbi:MAG: PAS domain S-box protein [Syntrophobacteraceae bacterium]
MSKAKNVPTFESRLEMAGKKIVTCQEMERELLSSEASRQILHELSVHQIELEMQNEELRNAREALDISRARYFNLYDLAPVGYCTLSPGGSILEANLTAATMLGRERGALVESRLSEFVHREDQDIYHLHTKRLFSKQDRQICELRMVRKKGEPFWARLESSACSAEGVGTVCRMAISDITETRRAEEEACAQKEILEKIFESAPYGMLVVDEKMRVRRINRACAEFWGKPKEEVTGLLAGEVFDCRFSPDKLGGRGNAQCAGCPVQSRVERTFRTGETIRDAEVKMTIRKGSEDVAIDFLLSTTLIRDKGSDLVLLTLADVTERTRAQKALRESEERFRDVAENIREVFWVRDPDRLSYVSPAYEQIWGRSSDPLYRDTFSLLESIAPAHRERIRQALAAEKNAQSSLREEFSITRPDGTTRWIRARSFPVFNKGEIVRRVGIAEDITAERETEEFLRIQKDLALGLGSSGSLEEAMEKLLNSCLGLNGLDSGAIHVMEEKTKALRLVCHRGLSDAFVRSIAVFESESPQMQFVLRGKSGCWQRPFEKMIIADLLNREGISTFLVIPVKHHEEVIALLGLGSHIQPLIPCSIRDAFEVVATEIARVISRIQLADTVKSQSSRLQETNAALKVLLKQRENDRSELEQSLLKNVRHLILPYMEKLKKSRLADEQKNLLTIVESQLLDMTSPFVNKISEPLLGLTPTEIRVADLIRQGKSSKEISDLLGVSEYAVVFHRQGIRRKLHLTGRKRNLQTYLSMLEQQP